MGAFRGNSGGFQSAGFTSSFAYTFPANKQPAPGQKIVMYVACHAAISLSDNGLIPATWTQAVSETTGGATTVQIWWADYITLPAGGSPFTVTVTIPGGNSIFAVGIAYSGVKAGPPTQTNRGTATGTAVSTGSVTPGGSGALYAAIFADQSLLAAESITPTGPGFSLQGINTNGSGSVNAGAVFDKIDTANPVATAMTWTLGDSVLWVAAIAVWDAMPYGGPGGTPAFIAGMETVPSDWDGWLGANFGAIARSTMLRALLTSGQALSGPATTILQFNQILEDPFGNWNASNWSWLAPWTGWYEISVATVFNPATIAIEPQVLLSGTFTYELSAAGITNSFAGGECGSVIVPMNAGLDFIQAEAYVGAAATTATASAGLYTSMEISFVST